jgi:uncharacterized protein YecT (DUF1311 family)
MSRHFLALVLLATISAAAASQATDSSTDEASRVLSADFRKCFGKDAPLNAESYDCLDREYRRLDALLIKEYRSALDRQSNDTGRRKLTQDERRWWRIRFRHCRDEVGDFRGSTAAVINQNCEIEALAQRIVELRHYGR